MQTTASKKLASAFLATALVGALTPVQIIPAVAFASNDAAAETSSNATYKGIAIDGDFSDWDAVAKYDVDDSADAWGNKKTWDTVNGVSMVWDGDWVYLYFESNADDPGAVTGAGPNNNGQFAITTDLGNQTLIQLQRGNGTLVVSGVEGASIKVNNYDWAKTPHKCEVAIPASLLGDYKESINFGMYQVEPTIIGVKDLQGSKGGEFNGIVYDGEYSDWTYYPHTTIQYATSGTGEHAVDAKGALYADNSSHTLFGHAVTTMPEHVNDDMGAIELSHAISLRVNGDDNLMFTPRFVAVDEAGNIDWNSDPGKLANGTYEFYLFSTTCNATSANINDLQNDDVCYGKAKITITDGKAETEWEIDIPTLAAHLHGNWGQSKDFTAIDADSIKKFEVQYGRLGQQWITTAGTSTAPFVGIGVCLAAVGGVYAWRRKKGGAAPAAANVAGGSGSEGL